MTPARYQPPCLDISVPPHLPRLLQGSEDLVFRPQCPVYCKALLHWSKAGDVTGHGFGHRSMKNKQ
ncbi:hypothetical protein JYU34_019638 [Plutella xylostella]|uniref:Uncharacterized protein n=1 Tax=Plutella xylostella TaxID=51655 RepID=A0ABQ7PXX6_PLUXY|nr:hypothetical protein JYU34_019638 [Plutella xylostella]